MKTSRQDIYEHLVLVCRNRFCERLIDRWAVK
jgi:hypothetical protein